MLETRPNSQGNQKILAIEDDPEVLALYKTYLQKRGYEVISATGAVEGTCHATSQRDARRPHSRSPEATREGRRGWTRFRASSAMACSDSP